jgi:hypothetical protein
MCLELYCSFFFFNFASKLELIVRLIHWNWAYCSKKELKQPGHFEILLNILSMRFALYFESSPLQGHSEWMRNCTCLFLKAAVHSLNSNKNFTDAWKFWKYAYNWAILVLTIQTVTMDNFWKYIGSEKITLKPMKFDLYNGFCSHFHTFYTTELQFYMNKHNACGFISCFMDQPLKMLSKNTFYA